MLPCLGGGFIASELFQSSISLYMYTPLISPNGVKWLPVVLLSLVCVIVWGDHWLSMNTYCVVTVHNRHWLSLNGTHHCSVIALIQTDQLEI